MPIRFAEGVDENGDPVAVANDDGDVETPSLIVLAES